MSGRNGTMVNGFDGQAAFELSPPPMIGVLPATTVVYILLGFGALLPILLLTVVAVTLCVRRRRRKSSSSGNTAHVGFAHDCHSNVAGFDFDITDDVCIDDVFEGKTWSTQRGWETRDWENTDRGMDYRKQTAEVGSKVAVHSVNNPNVYFRNRISESQSDDESRVPCSDVVVEQTEIYVTGPEKSFSSSNCRSCEPGSPPPSCDVTVTSSSRSDVGGDALSIDPTSDDVAESASSTLEPQVATLNRIQSTTKSALEQEEEQVLRSEHSVNKTQ